MSTAIFIYSPELNGLDLFGFTDCNKEHTLWKIYYGNGYGIDMIYVDKDGEGLFPEDFPNKRVYLQFLKENKNKYTSIGFILSNELLAEFSSKLKKSFFIYIGLTENVDLYMNAPKIKMSFLDITSKTIFKQKVLYEVFFC
ncbi:hypothetical protein [Neisseria dumasiana]|uniref:hypothetical protein n=1 Tax=Neisseria dumasiana TaxID=1931275 RepID=UPI000A199A3C|nr:hypothetical protein [Neisseria dumasiana]OSI16407.1 hypothetical protein BV914_03600 [Neisseria dumasiana]